MKAFKVINNTANLYEVIINKRVKINPFHQLHPNLNAE